jgi:hypothetical protein
MNIKFVKTCTACPEQYEAFIGKKQVGYLRLRWGYFEVEYPDVGGKELLGIQIDKSGWQGEFNDEEQRKFYLKKAKEVITKKILKEIK